MHLFQKSDLSCFFDAGQVFSYRMEVVQSGLEGQEKGQQPIHSEEGPQDSMTRQF